MQRGKNLAFRLYWTTLWMVKVAVVPALPAAPAPVMHIPIFLSPAKPCHGVDFVLKPT